MSQAETKIDVSAIEVSKCTAKEFPAGEVRPEAGELRVSIGRRVYDELRKHAAEDSEHEVCGVLLGDLCRDRHGPFLHVTEMIRGEHTASQGAQVTITHETWNHFHRIKDSRFADKQYLGWYHSHPDFGIFLSSMDLFIHQNFFNAPHQVALVVDPIRREEGMFAWKEGAPERAGRFWVGRDEHSYEAPPEPSRAEVELREVTKRLDRLESHARELAELVRRGPDGNWLQSAVLIGVMLMLALMVFKEWWSEGAANRVFDEDRVRRRMMDVRIDPAGRFMDLEYRVPPAAFRTETVEDMSGGQVLRFRLGPDQVEEYIRQVLREEAERLGSRASDPAPPQTSPMTPEGDRAGPTERRDGAP